MVGLVYDESSKELSREGESKGSAVNAIEYLMAPEDGQYMLFIHTNGDEGEELIQEVGFDTETQFREVAQPFLENPLIENDRTFGFKSSSWGSERVILDPLELKLNEDEPVPVMFFDPDSEALHGEGDKTDKSMRVNSIAALKQKKGLKLELELSSGDAPDPHSVIKHTLDMKKYSEAKELLSTFNLKLPFLKKAKIGEPQKLFLSDDYVTALQGSDSVVIEQVNEDEISTSHIAPELDGVVVTTNTMKLEHDEVNSLVDVTKIRNVPLSEAVSEKLLGGGQNVPAAARSYALSVAMAVNERKDKFNYFVPMANDPEKTAKQILSLEPTFSEEDVELIPPGVVSLNKPLSPSSYQELEGIKAINGGLAEVFHTSAELELPESIAESVRQQLLVSYEVAPDITAKDLEELLAGGQGDQLSLQAQTLETLARKDLGITVVLKSAIAEQEAGWLSTSADLSVAPALSYKYDESLINNRCNDMIDSVNDIWGEDLIERYASCFESGPVQGAAIMQQDVAVKHAFLQSKGIEVPITTQAKQVHPIVNTPAARKFVANLDAHLQEAKERKGDSYDEEMEIGTYCIANQEQLHTTLERAYRTMLNKELKQMEKLGVSKPQELLEKNIPNIDELGAAIVGQGLDKLREPKEVNLSILDKRVEAKLNRFPKEEFHNWVTTKIKNATYSPHYKLDGLEYGENDLAAHTIMLKSALEQPKDVAAKSRIEQLVMSANAGRGSLFELANDGHLANQKSVEDTQADFVQKFEWIASDLAASSGMTKEYAESALYISMQNHLSASVEFESNTDALKTQLEKQFSAVSDIDVLRLDRLCSDMKNTPLSLAQACIDGAKFNSNDVEAVLIKQVTDPEAALLQQEQVTALQRIGIKTVLYPDGDPVAKLNAINHAAEAKIEVSKPNVYSSKIITGMNEMHELAAVARKQFKYLDVELHETALTMDGLPDVLKANSKRLNALAKGSTVYLNQDGLNGKTIEAATKYITHEALHTGLRRLYSFGEHAQIMESVWSSMNDTDRSRIQSIYTHLNPESVEEKRELAEEYLALIAETVDPSDLGNKPSFLENIGYERRLKNNVMTTDDMLALVTKSLKECNEPNSVFERETSQKTVEVFESTGLRYTLPVDNAPSMQKELADPGMVAISHGGEQPTIEQESGRPKWLSLGSKPAEKEEKKVSSEVEKPVKAKANSRDLDFI